MILMKILFRYPPTLSFIYINKANPKILIKSKVAKRSLVNAQQKKKRERRGAKKVESKSQVFCVTIKPTNYLKFAFCTCLNFGR